VKVFHNEPGGEAPLSSRPPQNRLARTFSSLTIPLFRTLWIGMLFSMASMQINIVSRSWLAYHLSGSALTLGLVAIARGLPQIILSPIGGVLADRVDKRKMLLLSQSTMCLLSLGNAVLVHLGIIQVWHLIVIGMLQGTVFPFTMPVRQAYIPELVGTAHLPNALAMDSTGRNINRVLAPSLAGLLIAWHPVVAFYSIALLYFGAVLTIIRLPSPRLAAVVHKSYLQEMMIGFRYITGNALLLSLISMSFLAVVLGMPFQQLLPVFQIEVLHVGPAQLGFMYASVGVGALLGSLLVAYLSSDPRIGLFQVIACIGFGISLLFFAISTIYWLSLIFLAFVGATSQGYLTLNRTLVLLNTDKAFYGRVMGVYMMTWSLMPVATLPMGALVDAIGAPFTIGGGGFLLAACILLASLMHRETAYKSRETC